MYKFIIIFIAALTFTGFESAQANEVEASGSSFCMPLAWVITPCNDENFQVAAKAADQEAKKLCGEAVAERTSDYTFSDYSTRFGYYAKAQASYECREIEPRAAVVCTAQIPTSVCGTGVMQIGLFENDATEISSFELVNGDVGCWFSEFTVSGELEEIKPPHHLITYKKYALHATKRNEPAIIGSLVFGKRSSGDQELAYLELVANDLTNGYGALHGRYNLACERN